MSPRDELKTDAERIQRNALLHEIYRDVYSRLIAEVPAAAYPRAVELGSGGGFLKSVASHVITSEPFANANVDRVVDACRIDAHFAEGGLDAIVGFDVFHHLPDAAGFLAGASRVLRPGGRIALVEPWFTPLGQWFHRLIHHEPFILDPANWGIRTGVGRLGSANTRLPTSVFRDSDPRFTREFPRLAIVKREPFHKWLYLGSGGLKLNTHVPRWVARRLVALDRSFRAADRLAGIFALVVVERREH